MRNSLVLNSSGSLRLFQREEYSGNLSRKSVYLKESEKPLKSLYIHSCYYVRNFKNLHNTSNYFN